MPFRRPPVPLLVFTLGLAGASLAAASCAPVPSSSVGETPGKPSRLITPEKIRSWGVRTAWEAVRRAGGVSVRESSGGSAMHMRGRGSLLLNEMPLVVVDGAHTADVSVLRSIQAHTIASIEILNAPQATARHGARAGGGAIVVMTRRR